MSLPRRFPAPSSLPPSAPSSLSFFLSHSRPNGPLFSKNHPQINGQQLRFKGNQLQPRGVRRSAGAARGGKKKRGGAAAMGGNQKMTRMQMMTDMLYASHSPMPRPAIPLLNLRRSGLIPTPSQHETIERAYQLFKRHRREDLENRLKGRFSAMRGAIETLKQLRECGALEVSGYGGKKVEKKVIEGDVEAGEEGGEGQQQPSPSAMKTIILEPDLYSLTVEGRQFGNARQKPGGIGLVGPGGLTREELKSVEALASSGAGIGGKIKRRKEEERLEGLFPREMKVPAERFLGDLVEMGIGEDIAKKRASGKVETEEEKRLWDEGWKRPKVITAPPSTTSGTAATSKA